jgi:hypothetical protein
VVDVTPSVFSNFALVLLCDNSPLNGLRAFPAGVNVAADDLKTHRVEADAASGGPAPAADTAEPNAPTKTEAEAPEARGGKGAEETAGG